VDLRKVESGKGKVERGNGSAECGSTSSPRAEGDKNSAPLDQAQGRVRHDHAIGVTRCGVEDPEPGEGSGKG
jgi:hypothetical protein